MAEKETSKQEPPVPAADASAQARPEGVELTDEQLDKVSGGVGDFTSVSNVLKTRHDTAKNSIGN